MRLVALEEFEEMMLNGRSATAARCRRGALSALEGAQRVMRAGSASLRDAGGLPAAKYIC